MVSREIERKFLVKQLPERLDQFPHQEIVQGYLAAESSGVQVRLRKKGNAHSLTYKRDTENGREEREISLSAEQFDTLWPATAGRRLTKQRYEVPCNEHIIEIDVYRGRHDGLVVAEVEFGDDQACVDFNPPEWLGEEVTGQSRYSNVLLAQYEPTA
jgi:adenylate cyclase